MKIQLNRGVLHETRWYEYALRFLAGGLITAATGIIAEKFGPVIAGLFLAFPAILPSTATLIEAHEKEKQQAQSPAGTKRGRTAAGLDAAGAAMGGIGLITFALVVWRFISKESPWVVLVAATTLWFIVSVVVWLVRKRL